MANPNIVNVTTIVANTLTQNVTTSSANIVSNPSSSGAVYKINSLSAANINASAGSIDVQINNNGTVTNIAKGIVVPATSIITIIGKDNGFYLLENSSIQLTASANNTIHAICSLEQIS